jgi:hypothetical protein
VLIPDLQNCFFVLIYELLNQAQLMVGETPRSFNPDRIKPKLRRRTISADVNMGRLIPLSRVEEELVWPNIVKFGHSSIPSN